jgi:type II secretory pathway predicted ATPase ExeA
MYEEHFGFTRRPFSAAPQVEFYYPSASAEHARTTLGRAIERAAGPGLLIGPAGTGKTLLCHVLGGQFEDDFRVVLLASGRLGSPRALLQAILYELGLPYRDREEGELRLALIDHLAPGPGCPRGMLLLVDEAHTLPLRLLEEIRMITNLVRDGQPRVRLILAGAPILEERFASPKLESFNQRIAARCYLGPLNGEETAAFVRAQLAAVDCPERGIFSDEALRAIHRATDGIPRLVNQLCDQALLLAWLGRRDAIDADGIEEAWADLQQLPPPASLEEKRDPAAGDGAVVEFGSLDDTDDAEPPSEHKPALDASTDLARIELQVAGISREMAGGPDTVPGDEFRPAGRIGPELELAFHGTADPFAETFDEEEVVIDHYASLDSNTLKNWPRVQSAEGRELAALLARHEHATPKGSDAVTPVQAVSAESNVVRESRAAENPATEQASPPAPVQEERYDDRRDAGAPPRHAPGTQAAIDVVEPPMEENVAADWEPRRAATSTAPAPRSLSSPAIKVPAEEPVLPAAKIDRVLPEVQPLIGGQESEQAPGGRVPRLRDDRDLIVIEDEPGTGEHGNVPPAGRARRQEYRQLFARLRRG